MLWWLLACAGPGGDSGGGPGGGPGGGDAGDSGAPDTAFAEVTVEVTAMPTVLRVHWDSGDADGAWVRFSGPDGVERQTPVAPEGETLLLGLPASSDVSVVACQATGEEERCSAPQSARTGALPASLPVLEVEGVLPEAYVATVLYQEVGTALLVVDAQGRIVFHQTLPGTGFRARLARDHSGFLVNLQRDKADGSVVHIDWTGNVTERWVQGGLHTDFTELPDGRLLSLATEGVDCQNASGQDVRLMGDALYMLEGDTPVRIWGAHDAITPDCSGQAPWDGGITPEWTHANGLSYDAATDTVFVVLALLQTVAAIDLAQRETRWLVASEGPPEAIATDPALAILNPHSAYATADDGLVVFNRGEYDGGCSSVGWLAVDPDAGTATETARYEHPDCLATPMLGEAQPTDDGGTLVVWTIDGVLQRLDADRQSVWTLHAPLGNAFGYSQPLADLYPR